mmetsp:Transcript_11136/g.36658  ORF Transcript_11136/g.36658 Transcript_11136/m.36658 type:complete len:530 (-) Transcript_11136:70-1659(-)
MHMPVRHELVELALAEDVPRDVEPRVLPHHRLVQVERLEEPVVRRAARLELERAERVRDILERVHDAVRVVVARVDAPRAPRVRVRRELDPVRDQVEHVVVFVAHVLLHPQRRAPLRPHPAAHLLEEPQRLRHGAVTPRRVGALLPGHLDLVARLVAHVGATELDELHRQLVQLLEIVARVRNLPGRPPHPAHNLLDVLDVLRLFGVGVGVVEAQVARAALLRRVPEVHVHSLGVPDVEVAVRLGREARHNLALRRGEVLVQLGTRVGGSPDGAVAEVDGGVRRIVRGVVGQVRERVDARLLRRRARRLRLLRRRRRRRVLLLCRRRRRLCLLLLRRLGQVSLRLGAQHRQQLLVKLHLGRLAVRPRLLLPDRRQKNTHVHAVPLLLELHLVLLQHLSHGRSNLLRCHLNANARSSCECTLVKRVRAELEQESMCCIDLNHSLDLGGDDVGEQRWAVHKSVWWELGRHLEQQDAHRLVAPGARHSRLGRHLRQHRRELGVLVQLRRALRLNPKRQRKRFGPHAYHLPFF